MYTSVSKLFALGLLAAAPLASALVIPSQSQDVARSVEPIEARHHTPAQIAVSIYRYIPPRLLSLPQISGTALGVESNT